jgi:large repetitive protein
MFPRASVNVGRVSKVTRALLQASAILWAVLLAILAQISPAAAAPFTCSGDVYQVQSGQLKIFNPLTSSYVNIGVASSSYNATGFNTLGNFAFGVQGNNLIRIHADGSIDVLHNMGVTSNAADMDLSNNLVLKPTTNTVRIQSVLSPFTSTTVTTNGATFNPADFAWIESAGTPYLIGFESNGTLSRLNLTTNVNTNTNVTVAGLPASGYGATWRDSANRVFTFNNNTGIIYEIKNYLTNTPTATVVATGIPSGNNDGFSCPNAPFPNLAPLAFNDTYTTALNTAVVSNVLNDNGAGADNDPEGTPLTVTTTPVTGPTNGSVVLAANGAFTYTPNTNFVGTDTFVYRITDGSGLTDTATVTITITPPTANVVTVKTRLSATGTPSVGDTVQFQIVVTNIGPGTAVGASLTDLLPSSLVYSSNTVTQGTYTPATGVWSIGAINNGGSATLVLSAIVGPGQQGNTLTNTTTAATGSFTDSTNTGNDLSESVAVNNFSHSIVKVQTGAPNPVTTAGQTITYTITVDNTGNASLTTIVVTDTLLLGTSSRTLTTGPTRTAGDTNNNNIMEASETWTYTATYVVTQADLNSTGNFSNTATVDSAQTSPITSSAAVTPVTRSPTLSITKTPSTLGPVNVGNTISYTYDVRNTGNVTINNVSVSDVHNGNGTLPVPGSEFLSTDVAPTGTSTDSTANNAVWSILQPGDTVRFTANYTVQQADIDLLQ